MDFVFGFSLIYFFSLRVLLTPLWYLYLSFHIKSNITKMIIEFINYL